MDQSLLGMLAVAPHSAEMHMIMGGELGREGWRLRLALHGGDQLAKRGGQTLKAFGCAGG